MRSVALVLLCATLARAAPTKRAATSGDTAAALVELYTSEGCSSCPPADRWLSDAAPRLGRAVPLALHVDYWDSIGWPDAFAKAAFGERQERTAKRTGADVYTPALVVNGRVVADRASALEAVRRAQATKPRASITVETELAGGALDVHARALVPAAADRAHAALYVVVFESGLDVAVRSGENRGRTLHHDFVAREWLGPFPVGADGAAELRRAIALPRGARPEALGVAAFVEDRASGDVLQALAL
jgi:hypothetical protein